MIAPCRSLVLLLTAVVVSGQQHYVFLNRDRARIADAAFLEHPKLTGAQIKYVWPELEPEKDRYDFSTIQKDSDFLRQKGKALFIQVQDVSFSEEIVNVPRYLREAGGVVRQYEEEGKKRVPNGWVARRWDPAVRERFHLLLSALGAKFDGQIAGINLAETAIGVKEGEAGFTNSGYRDAVIANMAALKQAFPKSVTMQYANFMPGEWLPWENKGYLQRVYEAARRLKVGLGGPDLLPHRKGQLSHAYPRIAESHGVVPTGVAVQEGNYQHQHPKTGRRLTVSELHGFARDTVKVDYIFWSTQEPFYTRDVLPYLRR